MCHSEIGDVYLRPMFRDIWQSIALFEGAQAFSASPSGNSSLQLKTKMDLWWNGSDRGKLKLSERKTTST